VTQLVRFMLQRLRLTIGDNVSAGFGCTLSCVNWLDIGHDVTIGGNDYIADSHHDYSNPFIGVLDQAFLPGKISTGPDDLDGIHVLPYFTCKKVKKRCYDSV